VLVHLPNRNFRYPILVLECNIIAAAMLAPKGDERRLPGYAMCTRTGTRRVSRRFERDVGVVSENERAKSALLLIWPLLERKLVACILEKHAGVAARNNLEERLKSECAEGTLWTHFILA
jgi:hypothetical protein